MATVIDALVVSLGLDVTQFRKAQREASDSFRRTKDDAVKHAKGIEDATAKAGDAVSRLTGNFLKLFALLGAGHEFKQLAADITRADAAVGRLGQSLATAPQAISGMANAVERAGGSADAAAQSFQTFSDHIQELKATGDTSILPFLNRLQAAGGKQINLNKSLSETFGDIAENLKAVQAKQGDATANWLGRQLGFDPGTVALLDQGREAVRAALEESQRLGAASKADTDAARDRQRAWSSLNQAFTDTVRTVTTALSPVLVELLRDVERLVLAAKDFLRSDFFKAFAEGATACANAIGGWAKAIEVLFGLFLGARFLAVLRALGTLRTLLMGGAAVGAAGAAVAGGGGLLGTLAIIGGVLAAGAAAYAYLRGGKSGGQAGGAQAAEGGGPPAGASTGARPISQSHLNIGRGSPEVADYIRKAAAARGIDPDTAVAVANSEGLRVFNPSAPRDTTGGDHGHAFGPYQLHDQFLGARALAQGINIRDPGSWRRQVDFALDRAKAHGWSDWHGAARIGVGPWQGIGGSAAGAPAARTGGVDSRLIDIINNAKSGLPNGYSARVISGLRPGDPRFHGQGLAADVAIFDAQGRKLANYQDASTFRTYERFAQAARRYQMQKYPDLARALRWGGYFGGPAGRYGAMDTMHFDLGGNRVGMGGGSWERGLTPAQRRMFPGVESRGMGDYGSAENAARPNGAGAYAASVKMAHAANTTNAYDNRRTITSSSETSIGTINVHTRATDASGIARDLEPALRRGGHANAAQYGMA
ncbi:hypothetical protein [Methylobacterium sp. JK268]